jgi:anthranilate synthase component 1
VVLASASEGQFAQARQRIDELALGLQKNASSSPLYVHEGEVSKLDFVSGFSEQGFKQAVVKAKDYIAAGDVMQVVLSQRLNADFKGDAVNVYRHLRRLNPSPYMYYLNMGEFEIVGSSPEILVRQEGDEVTVRPIAGTRPRGENQQQDIALEKELLADPKELAEHLMLIDLGRNDIGRIAQVGTVELTDKMIVERYSHVMHIVSNVKGKLAPDYSCMDVLRATFPAGTVSGAPKIRAMEIIDELEPVKRGVYSGAVGYISWQGDMDTAIAIRTAVIKDGTISVQAGAGIVYDSVPENEWIETLNKAKAVLRAAAAAEKAGSRP